jgi:hypothetical protein
MILAPQTSRRYGITVNCYAAFKIVNVKEYKGTNKTILSDNNNPQKSAPLVPFSKLMLPQTNFSLII